MELHLSFLYQRLENFDKYGDFTKKFIHIGNHLRGLKSYPDNIKLKLKRDTFIMFHVNGEAYLIDTIKLPDNLGSIISTQYGNIKGVRLFNWKKEPMPALLKLIGKFIDNPSLAVKMAATIIDPLVVGKVYAGNRLIGNAVRQSDIDSYRDQGAKIVFSATIDRELQPKINAKRKS